MKKILILFAITLGLIACKKNEPLDLTIMSFNIRYDNPADSINNWQYRKDVAAQTIKNNNIDIVGTQEVLHNQIVDLKDRLPEYTQIGVGRQDGKEAGEYSAIFYKKNKFTEVKSGTFWLSEDTQAVGQKGWDAACERVATWAVLKDIKTEKSFFVLNTHFDHMGQIARRESAKLILSKANELSNNLPIIITGDFNATPNSEVIQIITDTTHVNHLTHTKTIAAETAGTDWTFHGFDKVPLENREFIDYIFVKGDIKVNKHEVLDEKLNDIFVSDHKPVVAKIVIQ